MSAEERETWVILDTGASVHLFCTSFGHPVTEGQEITLRSVHGQKKSNTDSRFSVLYMNNNITILSKDPEHVVSVKEFYQNNPVATEYFDAPELLLPVLVRN